MRARELLSDIVIKECSNLDPVTKLFDIHRNDPFTYLADVHLYRIFSRLKSFRAFVAEADSQVVGCIQALRYMYDCGYIGGILVHREFRRRGIGRGLLRRALGYLGEGSNFLYVEPENVIAKRFFEEEGLEAIYRRLNYFIASPLTESREKHTPICYDVGWEDLKTAIGFEDRGRTVSMGFYPVKVTRHVFEDLKDKRKILKCGDVFTVVENSYNLDVNTYSFTFNDYIIEGASISPKEKVIEVNPFYAKPQAHGLIELVNRLSSKGKVVIWTYQGDPVVKKLPLKGELGALAMEHSNNL